MLPNVGIEVYQPEWSTFGGIYLVNTDEIGKHIFVKNYPKDWLKSKIGVILEYYYNSEPNKKYTSKIIRLYDFKYIFFTNYNDCQEYCDKLNEN